MKPRLRTYALGKGLRSISLESLKTINFLKHDGTSCFLENPFSKSYHLIYVFCLFLGTLDMKSHETTNGLSPLLCTICSSICQKLGLFEIQDSYTDLGNYFTSLLNLNVLLKLCYPWMIFIRNQLVSLFFIKSHKYV